MYIVKIQHSKSTVCHLSFQTRNVFLWILVVFVSQNFTKILPTKMICINRIIFTWICVHQTFRRQNYVDWNHHNYIYITSNDAGYSHVLECGTICSFFATLTLAPLLENFPLVWSTHYFIIIIILDLILHFTVR